NRLLEAGRATRDPRPLQQLVDTMFCSIPAEAALDFLGDLACERGDFDRARRYWSLLVSDPKTNFSYPSPRGDPAGIRAKLVLLRILAGDRPTESKLAAFRRDFPAAAGQLAGRSGRLAEILTDLAQAPESHVNFADTVSTTRT